ncbi:MAG TPA: dienelactone hydrolase family protein [Acidimicrobiales bacterium]|nr:dienelactone hydrolase family protein [Acidimicrobiales bacterium]
MGHLVEFPSNGSNGQGYLAVPESGSGPGVIVIQEWWGLVPHITDVCDRFAAEGFVALAPDLYHGETTTEPDEAGKLMMALNLDRAGRDMAGAISFLQDHDAVTSDAVGVTGFCMGGGLALVLACQQPDAVAACVPFYGVIPWPDAQPDWSRLEAAVQGHFAELDGMFGPDAVQQLQSTLDGLDKQAELIVYPGAEHAFFNDTRPEVYDADASELAWHRTVGFFRAHVR